MNFISDYNSYFCHNPYAWLSSSSDNERRLLLKKSDTAKIKVRLHMAEKKIFNWSRRLVFYFNLPKKYFWLSNCKNFVSSSHILTFSYSFSYFYIACNWCWSLAIHMNTEIKYKWKRERDETRLFLITVIRLWWRSTLSS